MLCPSFGNAIDRAARHAILHFRRKLLPANDWLLLAG